MRKPPLWQSLGALVVGMLSVSMGSILIRLAGDVSPFTIAFYRLFFASLLFAPLTLPRGGYRTLAGVGRWHLLAGLFLALHFACWIASLAETTLAVSVLLTNSAPILVAVVSNLVFGERLTLPGSLGIAAALAGTWLLFGTGIAPGEVHGALLALGGAVGLAGYLLAGRRIRRDSGLIAYVFPCYLMACLALLTLALLSGAPFRGFSAGTWLFLALLGLLPQGVGHTAYNWALGFMSATAVAVLMLGEPLLAPLLGWWILGEAISAAILPGATLILLGIVLVTGWGTRPPAATIPKETGEAG